MPESLSAVQIQTALKKLANPAKAKILSGFFKTGPGQYGEGDVFLGITVPQLRAFVKNFTLTLDESLLLLKSPVHEHRLAALFFMIRLYDAATSAEKKRIYQSYLQHTKFINNWDLIDLSCHRIVGDYLSERTRTPLTTLARSKDLWERRIAIVSTYHFIRRGEFEDTVKICEILINDRHDLIQKATGWMLREVGKRDVQVLENFLEKHCLQMPRTMLRYSIEKFSEAKRLGYLKRKIA